MMNGTKSFRKAYELYKKSEKKAYDEFFIESIEEEQHARVANAFLNGFYEINSHWSFCYTFVFRPDLDCNVMQVTDFSSDDGYQNELYDHIKKRFRSFKHKRIDFSSVNPKYPIQKLLIHSAYKDKMNVLLKKEMNITGIELFGTVDEGLKFFESQKFQRSECSFRCKLLTKKEMEKCIKLDILAHRRDKSSRMHIRFSKRDAYQMMKPFYVRLIKNKCAFLAYPINDKKEILGKIAFFENTTTNTSAIASIFVNSKYQGQGIGKFLYFCALREMNARGQKFYIGCSTTDNVLKFSKKLKRKPTKIYFVSK